MDYLISLILKKKKKINFRKMKLSEIKHHLFISPNELTIKRKTSVYKFVHYNKL